MLFVAQHDLANHRNVCMTVSNLVFYNSTIRTSSRVLLQTAHFAITIFSTFQATWRPHVSRVRRSRKIARFRTPTSNMSNDRNTNDGRAQAFSEGDKPPTGRNEAVPSTGKAPQEGQGGFQPLTGGYHKHQCAFWLKRNCSNWVWVNGAACPHCMVGILYCHRILICANVTQADGFFGSR